MPVVDLLDLDRGGSSTQQERHTLKPLLPSIHKRWATTPVRRTIAPISLFAKQVAKENSVLREVFDDALGIIPNHSAGSLLLFLRRRTHARLAYPGMSHG